MSKLNIPKEKEEEIIRFYLTPNSAAETARQFNLSRTYIDHLLTRYSIQKHTPEIYWKLKQEKAQQTTLDHYGVINPFEAEEVKEKIKETCLERFGVENAAKSTIVKDKIKSACIEKYGVANYAKTKEFKEKVTKTCLLKYGHKSPKQSEEIKHKTAETCRLKYGVTNVMQHAPIRAKAAQTCLERYGVESPLQTEQALKNRRSKYAYNNEAFDSFPELCFYLYCLENNLNIERCPVRLPYIHNDKQHYYIPDFRVNNQLIEIKGDHLVDYDGTWRNPFEPALNDLAKAKYNCAKNNQVKILYKEDYNKYIEWFNKQNYLKETFIAT